MRTAFGHGMVSVLLAVVSICALAAAQSQGDVTRRSSSSSDSSITSSSLTHDEHTSDTRHRTCQSGTVNYITHSLPQQCLSRPSNITDAASTVTTGNATTSTSMSSATTDNPPSAVSSGPGTEIEPEKDPESESESESESEGDSPLDKANFLSFEEWKKKNLPHHVGQQTKDKPPRNLAPINNALDVLGDDSEIELDFSGFGRQQDSTAPSDIKPQAPLSSGPALRSKDAGKTCKERSNYASFDCAATVLKSNPESKSASAVLIENKDSYMLNICQSPNKFLILELCDDILIDTVVLANYEFFSSIFRTFRVSVSDRYPVKLDRWKELGVFEARNTRSVQAFLIEQPLIWARYLRIEFLTHYGNEYYCPVSLLRVHGTTMMEEFRHQEELARGDIIDDLDEPETLAQEPAESSRPADSSVVVESVSPDPSSENSAVPSPPTSTPTSALSQTASTSSTSETFVSTNATSTFLQDTQNSTTTIAASIQPDSKPITSVLPHSTNEKVQNTSSYDATSRSPISTSDKIANTSIIEPTSSSSASSAWISSSVSPLPLSQSDHNNSTSSLSESKTRIPSSNSTSQSAMNTTTPSKSISTPIKSSSVASEVGQKPSTSTISASQPNPTTQESFFKSIHKRLQMLESNATLSLQYIEEQSRILRDAFIKVEKRQIKKTEAFLESLNSTVFAELQDFKQQYDQLWQSTVIELENHREQYQREILAVSARLGIVADELVFQKRMAIVQSTLLMLCLGLVLFVRAGTGAGLDIPIIQQMVNKSQLGRRSSYYSPLNSPSPDQSSSPEIRRDPRDRRGFWRSSPDTPTSPRPTSKGNGDFSEASVDDHPRRGNPNFRLDPPTPTCNSGHAGDSELEGEDGILVSPTMSSMNEDSVIENELVDDEDEDMASPTTAPQETQSSPSTPNGSRDQQTSLKMLPNWPSSARVAESDDDAASATTPPSPARDPVRSSEKHLDVESSNGSSADI